jgi:hypothetical protein
LSASISAFNFTADSLTNKNKIMKKIIFVCLLAIISATTIFAAQKHPVTDKVLKSFHDAFPDVKQTLANAYPNCNEKPLAGHAKTFLERNYKPGGTVTGKAGYYARGNAISILENVDNKYADKKIFAIPGLYNAGAEGISKKVLKKFNKKFNNIPNVKWEQIGDKFLATFLSGETTTKILFDEKGKLIYTINYSSEKLLPPGIKKLVNDKYKNYKITSVAKINEDNRQIWVVNLAGKSNYVATRIEDDEMEEIENFQKAN